MVNVTILFSKCTLSLQNYSKNMSLLEKCMDVLAKPNSIEIHKNDLGSLPNAIKTSLLTKLCKRGHMKNTFVFKQLLNSNITTMDLSECEVTNDLLLHLHTCTLLQKLDLSLGRRQNRNISSDVLKFLFQHLHFLKVIVIPNCSEINNEVIEAICENCKQLKELYIPNSSITDYSLKIIGQSLHNLVVLDISKTGVTDKGISSLVKGILSQTLQEINFDKCPNLTYNSVVIIAENLKNISVLNCGANYTDMEAYHLSMNDICSKTKQIFWNI